MTWLSIIISVISLSISGLTLWYTFTQNRFSSTVTVISKFDKIVLPIIEKICQIEEDKYNEKDDVKDLNSKVINKKDNNGIYIHKLINKKLKLKNTEYDIIDNSFIAMAHIVNLKIYLKKRRVDMNLIDQYMYTDLAAIDRILSPIIESHKEDQFNKYPVMKNVMNRYYDTISVFNENHKKNNPNDSKKISR